MRAAVWDGTALSVTDDVEVRPPGPGEVTVRVLASGICHSDLNVLDGNSRIRPPVILGHEAAGVVDGTGEPVVIRADVSGADDRPFTWAGQPVRSYAGISSWAERVTVPVERLVPRGDLPAAPAALVGCAATTGWGVVNNVARVRPGQRVAVLGVGGIGVNAIAACRLAGAEVIAVDVNLAKEEVALAFGAHRFTTSLADDVDITIECSGAPRAIEAALAHGRETTALVGIPPSGYRAPVDVNRLLAGHRVLGSYAGNTTHDDVCTVARLGDELRLADQVTRVWPLEQIDDAIAAVRAGDVVRAVLDLS